MTRVASASRRITRTIRGGLPPLQILGGLGALIVLVKLIAFARDAALASRLGTSSVVAAFVVVFGIQTALILVLCEAISVGSVKTMLTKGVNQDAILGAGLLLGLGVALGQYLGSSVIASGLTSDSPRLSAEVATALRWTAPSSGAFILMGSIAGVLYAQENFRLATALNLFWALGALGAAAFVPSARWAVYAGWSISITAVALVAFVLNLSDWRQLRPRKEALWGPLTIAAPTAIANMLFNGSFLIERKAAAGLGTSALAALGYSYKVASLPVSIYLGAITAWILPKFIRSAHQNDDFGRKVLYTVSVAFVTMGLSSLIIFLAGPLIVKLLFERGQFSSADSSLTAAALRGYAFSLPAIAGYMICVRAAQALGNYRAIVVAGALGALTTAIMVVPFRSAFGLMGITAATSLGNFASLAALGLTVMLKIRANHREPQSSGAV